ncbi:MAG: DUF1737 domain-containing protein [Bacteroidetes bacterium]|jgi:hypothetical protein|nr:DUF1737 domain-containing protein [Bacteroidota bacterium]MBT6686438.1 DUF1737 domain-containing protein [Bacteroidota bacterium]MBT7144677.1 DUF1737 domain-containing protein [Bacteroidota bacterium]MBT7491288.1 DUF1737 domain-containing protein [Bacteroidota bacterium]
MEYTVVEKKFLKKLIESVNDLVKEGWKIQGSINCTWVNSKEYKIYTQALVKE